MTAQGSYGCGPALTFPCGAAQAGESGAQSSAKGVCGGIAQRGLRFHAQKVGQVGGCAHPARSGAEVKRQALHFTARDAAFSWQTAYEQVHGVCG